MGTSIERYLDADEIAQTKKQIDVMARVNQGTAPAKFVFFAAFDGTNNDKDNLKLSGSPYQTNVANLFDQAEVNKGSSFVPKYYKGVGTGGEDGGKLSAGPSPTEPMLRKAELALQDFANAAHKYLINNPFATPADLSASAVGFSRGAGTAAINWGQTPIKYIKY